MWANILIHKDCLPASYFFSPWVSVNLSVFRLWTASGNGVLPTSWKIRNTSKTRWFCCGKAAFCVCSPCLKDRAFIFMVFNSLTKTSLPVLLITSKKIHLQLVPSMSSSFKTSKVFCATAHRRVLEHLPYKRRFCSNKISLSWNSVFCIKFQCYLIAS